MKKRTRQRLLLLAMVGLLIWNIQLSLKVDKLSSVNSTHTIETIERVVTDVETSLTQVVKDTEEKVVTITNYQKGQLSSSGSGVVYSVDGNDVTLVTNHHVIDRATSIKVKFINGKEYDASLVGSDEYSDLAILTTTIDFEIEPFKLGDSNLSSVGEQVLAIGSPLGEAYQGSVSYGIISGKNRTVEMDLDGNGVSDWDMVVLQTDAAINPGNSGGALINLAGELIGIPSSKIVSSNGENVEGMGFAIPINEVISIAQQLLEDGEVKRPIVGISAIAISDMNSYQRQYYGVGSLSLQGLYVTGIVENGPAQQAGLKEGDIIMAFDGSTILSYKEFRQMLYARRTNDKVVFTVQRGSQKLEIEVILD